MRNRALYLVLAALVVGCDMGDPGQHVPEPAVEAWLIAGAPPPPIRVSWTQSVDVAYRSVPVGIDDAEVILRWVASDGAVVRSYFYEPTGDDGGYHWPGLRGGIGSEILPGATYTLEVNVPGEDQVTGTTIVPGDFRVQDVPNRAVVYQATDQVEIDVTKSTYPGREAVYIITIESMEPSIEGLTPFVRDAIYSINADEEFDVDDLDISEIDDVIEQSSPPLNEANWEELPSGDLKLKMPWFFVAFYGENQITVSAIDDNVWNFFRGINAQEGNGGLSPGEIPNIRAGVVGGHGLFGSLARVKSSVEILREGAGS